MAMVSAIVAFSSCEKEGGNENEGNEGTGKPSIEWAANPDFDVMPIDENADANIVIKAPAGIKTFIVSIDSDALEAALGNINLSSELDLINDKTAAAILGGLYKVPTGDALLNQTEVNFDITKLLSMITTVAPEGDSEHTFTIKLTDNEGNALSQACVFSVNKPITETPAE